MLAITAIVVGYLLGAISFSYLAGRLLKGIDIREHGSGNAGATNTLRVLGKKPAIVVLLLDGLKGVAAVLIGFACSGGHAIVPVLCAVAAVVGHNWPVYFGFRGGKGVATTIGVMATLAFWPALIAGIVTIAVIAVTRYVSLGSLLFAVLLPVLIFVFHLNPVIFWAGVIFGIFSFYRHRSNIRRLISGTENKIGHKA